MSDLLVNDEEPELEPYYSVKTAEVLFNEIQQQTQDVESNDRCLILIGGGLTSLYYGLTDESIKKYLFVDKFLNEQIDNKKDDHIIQYRYDNPTEVPDALREKASFIIIEPDFIDQKIWVDYKKTIDIIRSSKDTPILAITTPENAETVQNAIQASPQLFLPSIPNLIYQYHIYATYKSESLSTTNSELEKLEKIIEESEKEAEKEHAKPERKERPIRTSSSVSTPSIRRVDKNLELLKKHKMPNYAFYTNKMPSIPQGALIDDIHKNWKDNFALLEYHHGYIQYLFPMFEAGMNYCSRPLTVEEQEAMLENEDCKKRLLVSYKMMLRFYGLSLKDDSTGEIEHDEGWESRYRAFTYHNNLRITRILKCLSLLGYPHFLKPFIRFMIDDILVHDNLSSSANSLMQFW
eukprot:CAMPEP_0117422576 /NCGR_PEP_ID=MMETSP0758-20121206/3387_1 /TAXON_ID=63605 /ORGANISM="Percolomonas cosmopolitus, Strain AE-1 (ATCC 50343)" /LENGTH=406 /DNA_ID=CAMNT_0005205277 /DNA_START=11 /DNA_END=1228 /DNA_ORIENTATION=-